MNKTNSIQCELCTEPTKHIIFCDGKNTGWNRWFCHNTECQHNDMLDKQKRENLRLQKAKEINRKTGVDVKHFVKMRIRAQLNIAEAAKLAGVGSARYSEWEHEKEPIPLAAYCMQIVRFSDEIRKHKCGNCQFYI